MDLVDKFLETVTDEFGNKIDFSNVESEGFEGIIRFESGNQADIHIDSYGYDVYNCTLYKSENDMIFEFIKYVQQKMGEHNIFLQDDINTKNSLYNYGKL